MKSLMLVLVLTTPGGVEVSTVLENWAIKPYQNASYVEHKCKNLALTINKQAHMFDRKVRAYCAYPTRKI